jgi:TetR/AcrR family transcriptional regulator, transcriptional repressor for nem operon
MLKRGYSALGVQDLLDEARVTKGSFYHHFGSKEAFALAVIDAYQANVHTVLDAVLADRSVPPLQRVRRFFTAVGEAYQSEGYLGCLLGGLGQELSGTSEVFRLKIDGCVAAIASRLALCLEEARVRGELPATLDPGAAADIIVNAWEGAALRSRLLRSGRPLTAVVDFCLSGMSAH